MARTPLLRALRQLAGEHDAAEQLGISVETTPSSSRIRLVTPVTWRMLSSQSRW